MREELKQKLDESVPEEVILSEMKKRQILEAAKKRNDSRKPLRTPKLLPALATVAVVGIAGILVFPYANDWQEHGTSQGIEESMKKVVIPRTEYSTSINAVYYEEQAERLIYQDEKEIYSYDIDEKTETLLVEASDGTLIQDVAAEGEWLVWTERMEANAEKFAELNVRNLSNGETVTISDLGATSLVIDGDQLSYLSVGIGEPTYKLLDLETLEETDLYQSMEGADSLQAFNEGLVVVPERREPIGITELRVYDAKNGTLKEDYKLPSETAANIQLNNNKIYAQLIDEDFTAVLTVIDLKTGKRSEIETPEFSAYAVYEDYLALSVPEGEADTVKLFKLEGNTLTALPTLDQIKERLVKPRFTDDGTLVVNGDGEEQAMYLLDITN